MSLTNEFGTYSAPPPPPLPSSLHLQKSVQNPQALNNSKPSKINENDLGAAVKKILDCDVSFSRIFHLSNTYLNPQLQDGPKCGLVALSIATSQKDNFIPVDDIFQAASSLGLTKQGEMFSADSLALLAEKCCGFQARVIKGGLNTHLCCIIKSLLRKKLLLVPYDADCNHSPCCKKGLKAHWALITGVLIVERNSEEKNAKDDNFVIINSLKCSAACNCIDENTDTDLRLTVSVHEEKLLIGKGSPKGIHESFRDGKIYLIAMQGKSRHIGLWLFDEVAKSNDNLIIFSVTRDSNEYILPEGGLKEGLKGKAIILDSY